MNLLNALVGLGAIACAASLSAAVVYSDDFSNPAGSLNGNAPDVRPGSETWSAAANYNYSGAGVLSVGGGFATMATLPFTPVAGNVYVATIQISIPNTSTTDWVGIGFYTNGSIWNPAAFALDRGTASIQTAFNGNWVERGTGITGASTPTNTIAVKLDTTAPQWVATLVVNGTDIPSSVTSFAPNGINSVGLTSATIASVDNFSLTTVPEPATLSLLGAAALTALRRRRIA